MDYTAMLEKIKNYVTITNHHNHKKQLLFHNHTHTEHVVRAAIRIGSHYALSDLDMFIITAAAWFHDVGYCIGKSSEHENLGADIAVSFLKDLGVEDAMIQSVKGCILATRMPQHPVTLLERIVCDADLFHLGTDDFTETNKLVRKEYELVNDVRISKEEWRNKAIQFVSGHHYHTDYAQQLLEDKKQQNLQKLKDKNLPAAQGHKDDDEEEEENTETSAKAKNNKPSRGIETMFRVTSSNHQRLSDMADNKAHILITVNSIILSAIITLLLRKLDDQSYLLWPTVLILGVSLITITFAILATRPSIPDGRFTREDVDQKRVNLLFFGNFYRMTLAEYNEGMLKMMDDNEFLYGSLIRDVYAQGIVLGKKYRLLRIAYNVFMFGLIASVLAYIVASLFQPKA